LVDVVADPESGWSRRAARTDNLPVILNRKLIRIVFALYWLAIATGTHWPRLDLEAAVHMKGKWTFFIPIDKVAHVTGFGGLAFLALMAELLAPGVRRRVVKTGLIISAYSIIDELTQVFVPGRDVGLDDMLASNIGVLCGCIGWVLYDWLVVHDNSFVAHTRVVSALTLLSRGFGLVRDAVLARVFGFTAVFDAFTIANMIPNLFRRLFGEGALSAAFIPLYTKLNHDQPELARRFAAIVVSFLIVALSALSLLIAAVLMGVSHFAHLEGRNELAIQLTVITILYMPLICSAAVLGGLLQVHNRFGVSAASPIIMNVLLIASAIIGYYGLWGGEDQRALAMFVAGAVVLSGLVQLIWAWLAMRAAGVKVSPAQLVGQSLRAARETPEIRDSLRKLWQQAWPTALGLSVFQLNALADQLIAWFFSATPDGPATFALLGRTVAYPMEVGAVSAMGRAQLLYEFPHGVFGIAVATAIFPALAKAAREPEKFAALLRQGLRLTVFIGLPASVGLILLRYPLSRAIFFPGDKLTDADAARVASILLGFATAIWAYSTNMLITRAFYAQQNTITPMRLSLAMVALNLTLNLTLIWPLGTAGLAWSTSICAMIQTVILLQLVKRYVPQPVDGDVKRSWLTTAGLTVLMTAVLWPVVHVLPINEMNRVLVIVVLGSLAGGGGAIFLGAAWLTKMPELRWLLSRHATPAEAKAAGE
jgi:putative peptidoglycan lipid II flippase